VVAILFVVFDAETVFLYPWAMQYQALGLYGLVEMLVFLGILIVGYVWHGNTARWIGFRFSRDRHEDTKKPRKTGRKQEPEMSSLLPWGG
jgi:hypothetical protein